MGQKVNPHGLRVGVIKDWDSRWYADTKNDEFSNNLVEDHKIRTYLKKTLYNANISKIEIERAADRVSLVLSSVRAELESKRSKQMHRSLQIRSCSSM